MKTYNDTIILATANPGKVREFSNLLAKWLAPDWQLVDRLSWTQPLADTIEDADTFEGNAIKKAVEIARATGCCALSDDSGLQVDALHGAPGVFSARYAGPDATDADNNAQLIQDLAHIPPSAKTARFVSVICLAITDTPIGRNLLARVDATFDEIPPLPISKHANHEGQFVRDDDVVTIWFRGTVEGLILDQPRGTHGFGYDPLFYLPENSKTMAELPLDAKNAISHRAVALEKLYNYFLQQ